MALMRKDPTEHRIVSTEEGRFLAREIGLPLTTCQYVSHGGWCVVQDMGNYINEIKVLPTSSRGGPLLTKELVTEVKDRFSTPDWDSFKQQLARNKTVLEDRCMEQSETYSRMAGILRRSAQARRALGITPHHPVLQMGVVGA